MTATSTLIDSLLAYSWKDWAVTQKEMQRIVTALKADGSIDATIRDLDASGGLHKLYVRVANPDLLRQVVSVLASRSSTASTIARKALLLAKGTNHVMTRTGAWTGYAVEEFHDICHDLGTASQTLGFSAAAGPVGSSAGPPASPIAPFSGVGATGTNPTTLSIGAIDQAKLAMGHGATVARYSNPIPGSLPAYLATLTPVQRLNQARTLVRQPISTVFPHAYRGNPPLRSQVILAAASVHNLEPELISAVILAEQRDQSLNEDAKDYVGAISIKKANTSIGLGQIVVSTARNSDLFADLLALAVRKALSHEGIATLLASDEFNIFGTARYVRQVANAASLIPIATLPGTQAAFPAIRMGSYAGHSSGWPRDNVRALGSEYTSRPWDDRVTVGWGDFLADAYNTFKTSGIPFP